MGDSMVGAGRAGFCGRLLRRGWLAIVTGSLGAGVAAPPAYGLGETAPAGFVTKAVDGKRTQKELAVETIDLVLQSPTVRDLQVRSEIEDAAGGVVEVGEAGRSILGRNPGMSLQPDVVVARLGDVVSVPRPHKRELAPGLYSETVRVAVTDADYSAPVVLSRTRFFRVTADAVETVSSEVYSRVVDGPGRTVRDRDGAPLQVHDGQAFSPVNPKSKKVAQPRFGADGRVANEDAPVKLPEARIEPSDESKED